MDNFNNQNNFNQNNQPYQYQQGDQYNQNQPYQYQQYQEQPESGKNFAIASLVMGILSLVCCGSFVFSILGIIFGVISKQRQKENNGMATAGLVLSIIAIALSIIGIIIAVATGILDAYAYSYYY
ncbi:MAG: DUF4190 domain-containing protein [Ruminococcus sp.]|nr:DUF4190 domain-containing protein [Ruminococcus sp.]